MSKGIRDPLNLLLFLDVVFVKVANCNYLEACVQSAYSLLICSPVIMLNLT